MEELTQKLAIQQQGLKWLAEYELLYDPQFINNLKLNILSVSKQIKEVEILSLHLYDKKDMLIWIDLTWLGGFRAESLKEKTETVVLNLLPKFNLRVTANYEIMRLALLRVNKFFTPPKEKRDHEAEKLSSKST